MNSYNLTVILDGKATAAKKKTAIEKIEGLVKTFEGVLGEVKDLGEKDLAYLINKKDTGIFLIFSIQFSGDMAKKFLDKIRLEDYILRYLMIRSEERVQVAEAPKKRTTTKKAKEEEIIQA